MNNFDLFKIRNFCDFCHYKFGQKIILDSMPNMCTHLVMCDLHADVLSTIYLLSLIRNQTSNYVRAFIRFQLTVISLRQQELYRMLE